MSIASSPVAASHPMASDGFDAEKVSSCLCACSRVSSGACSSRGLKALRAAGQLQFFSDLSGLKDGKAFRAYLAPLHKTEGVVHAKRPFAGPAQVLAYLARYTHRVAIGNSRLLDVDDTHVRFRWKDYREDGKSKVMTLEAGEFMRRFLLHVLPDGFHRIRHYGLLANGHRADKLARCRKLLGVSTTATDCSGGDPDDDGATRDDPPLCPCCGGRMKIIETFERGSWPRTHPTPSIDPDTS